MIQVIERTFGIIELLSRDGDLSLEGLSRSAGLNKGTLCNILRTLIKLGYVEKAGHGIYRLSDSFHLLSERNAWREQEGMIMQQAASVLAAELGESVLAGTLRREQVVIIAQAQFQRHLMVNQQILYAGLSLYHSVTGRILLSFVDAEVRRRIYEHCGPPLEDWNGIASLKELETATAIIRAEGISLMENRVDGIKSFAVPVMDRSRNLAAALALTMPIARLGADGGTLVIDALRRHAGRLEATLAAVGLDSHNFIRL
jgi:DNA-binding IclR family transcriptional regulator